MKMKIKETPRPHTTCLLILLLSLLSSFSLHAKDRDFTIFLNDLNTLLFDTALEAEINENNKAKNISYDSKPTLTSNRTLSVEKKENKKPVIADRIKCKDKKHSTVKTITNDNSNIASKSKTDNKKTDTKTTYWNKLHFIESSSGKKLYRKRNKARSCKWTTNPCGHHQLSVKALKDIGCTSLKCRSSRENYKNSLSMSKKLADINAKRMQKKGYKTLPDYQRYLVHQQGAYGLGKILDASKGKKSLSKKTLRYMANNSPFSYKILKRSGSRGAARKFLSFWKEKWDVKMSERVASR